MRTRPCRSMSCCGVVASARASISRTFGSCAAISSRSWSDSAWMCRTSASSISVPSKKSLTLSGAISGWSGSMIVGARIASSFGVASTGQVLTWQQPATPSSPRSSGETNFAPFSTRREQVRRQHALQQRVLAVAGRLLLGQRRDVLDAAASRGRGRRAAVSTIRSRRGPRARRSRRTTFARRGAELHAALDGPVLLAGGLQEAHLAGDERVDVGDDALDLHAVEGVRLRAARSRAGRRSRTASASRSSSRRACTGTARSPRTAASRRAARDATSST